jgi:hypothetical protein
VVKIRLAKVKNVVFLLLVKNFSVSRNLNPHKPFIERWR